MTLRVLVPNRKRTFSDRILGFFGRKRRLIVQCKDVDELYGKLGPAAYLAVQCQFQGFLAALLWGRKVPRRCW